jgi:hypothetical protein
MYAGGARGCKAGAVARAGHVAYSEVGRPPVNHARVVLVASAAALLFALAGCTTVRVLPRPPAAAGASTAPAKGQEGPITGRLAQNKNQYLLTDSRTGITYRFVGLGKDGEKALAPYVGKIVTVRLSVISTESAKAVNARFISIVS